MQKKKNRKRREKLGDLCFDLAKYILTAIVIGAFIEPNIKTILFWTGLVLSTVFLIVGYFLFPLDSKESKNE
jgi:hypothetical protein